MYNDILVIGNVGADPQTRQMPSGEQVSSFRMASNHTFNRIVDGETQQVETTEWFNVNCFGTLGETVAKYVERGMQVFVQGRLSSSAYIANDGEPRASLDIYADTVRFLGKREDRMQSGGGGGADAAAPGADEYGNPPSDAEYPENRRAAPQPHGAPAQRQPAGYGGQQAQRQQPPRRDNRPGGYGGQQGNYGGQQGGYQSDYDDQQGGYGGGQPQQGDIPNPLAGGGRY